MWDRFEQPFFLLLQKDTVEDKRKSKIGTIEVVRCDASYVKEEYRPIRDTNFNQANKKDAFKVTEGKYTMSTTKKGRYIHRSAPYDVQLKKLWRIGRECGRLTVNYRMGHTLEEMGIPLRSTDWSRVIVRKSNSTPPSSPPTTPAGSPVAARTDSELSRSSSPDSPPQPTHSSCNSNSQIISFTSTEIKQEMAEPVELQPAISPLQAVHISAT